MPGPSQSQPRPGVMPMSGTAMPGGMPTGTAFLPGQGMPNGPDMSGHMMPGMPNLSGMGTGPGSPQDMMKQFMDKINALRGGGGGPSPTTLAPQWAQDQWKSLQQQQQPDPRNIIQTLLQSRGVGVPNTMTPATNNYTPGILNKPQGTPPSGTMIS